MRSKPRFKTPSSIDVYGLDVLKRLSYTISLQTMVTFKWSTLDSSKDQRSLLLTSDKKRDATSLALWSQLVYPFDVVFRSPGEDKGL